MKEKLQICLEHFQIGIGTEYPLQRKECFETNSKNIICVFKIELLLLLYEALVILIDYLSLIFHSIVAFSITPFASDR